MIILTVNAGSSSIRLSAFAQKGNGIEKLAASKYNRGEDSSLIIETFIQDYKIKEVSIIAHRIVHGGTKFVNSCLIDTAVEKEIECLSSLAPLHNPFALEWIQICRATFSGHIPQIAVFDTAFYSTLPEIATIYAIPQNICKQYHIRRYGFHGIAHQALWKRWNELCPDLKNGGRVISLQLGAGCSITAVHHGKAVDTSMGFSPLEGLVMATRSGDIDPSVILYLQRSYRFSRDMVEKMLNCFSGLLGVSEISGDIQELLESNLPEAQLAVKLFCYRIRKYIGAYLAVLGGADAILFGGGVGENAPIVRKLILENMDWLGIILDLQANNAIIGKEGCINSSMSKIEVWVIPVDEASVLAQEAIEVIKKGLNE